MNFMGLTITSCYSPRTWYWRTKFFYVLFYKLIINQLQLNQLQLIVINYCIIFLFNFQQNHLRKPCIFQRFLVIHTNKPFSLFMQLKLEINLASTIFYFLIYNYVFISLFSFIRHTLNIYSIFFS